MADADVIDVLIVGAGPAGLAAAVQARACGAQRVVVLDENPAAGGQIWRGGQHLPHRARRWIRRFAASGAELRSGCQVIDAPGGHVLRVLDDTGYVADLRWTSLVLATGARERFLPFPGWTLPGIVGVGGLQALVKGGVPIAGSRVLIAGSGPLLIAVASSLHKRGAELVGIVEQAPATRIRRAMTPALVARPDRLLQAMTLLASLHGVPRYDANWPVRVERADTDEKTLVVTLRDGLTISTDWLACGFGLVPNTELAALLGCDVTVDGIVVDATQQTSRAAIFAAGEVTGIGGQPAATIEGTIAGAAAAGQPDGARRWQRAARRERHFRAASERAWALDPRLGTLPQPDTIVCRCEDVSLADALAVGDGNRARKLQTRCGMGPCQGRICGPALAFLTHTPVTPSPRPPLVPVPAQALTGDIPSPEIA